MKTRVFWDMMLCCWASMSPIFWKINVSSFSESQWRYHSSSRCQELFNQLHIPEDLTIKQQHCENLKSCRYYACRTYLTYKLYMNLLKPSGFFTCHQVEHSKILHGARFVLSVLYGYQNRQQLLLYTTLTG